MFGKRIKDVEDKLKTLIDVLESISAINVVYNHGKYEINKGPLCSLELHNSDKIDAILDHLGLKAVRGSTIHIKKKRKKNDTNS